MIALPGRPSADLNKESVITFLEACEDGFVENYFQDMLKKHLHLNLKRSTLKTEG